MKEGTKKKEKKKKSTHIREGVSPLSLAPGALCAVRLDAPPPRALPKRRRRDDETNERRRRRGDVLVRDSVRRRPERGFQRVGDESDHRIM